jgi:site-specific recombinase XerD
MLQLSLTPRQSVIQAEHLDLLIDAYLEDVQDRLDTRTVTSYRDQFTPFRVWWLDTAPARDYALSEKILGEFLPWVKTHYRNSRSRKASPATIRSGCVRVRQFFKWLHVTGRLPINIVQWVPMPAKPHTHKRFLSLEQCQALFNAVPNGSLRYRDRAMLGFLLGTGARRFEAAEVLWEDVTIFEDGSGYAHLRKVKGDNDGDLGGRIVAFGPATGALLHFHKRFLQIIGMWEQDPRVFGMTNTAIKLRFQVLTKRLGWEVGPHDLRRTFADFWFNTHRGSDRATVALKLQLGHSLSKDVTLSHYIDLANRERVAELLAASYVSPVERLNVDHMSR